MTGGAATETARLALATIGREPVRGIPTNFIHIMEHAAIERLAGAPPGAYRKDPHGVYLAMQKEIGACILDQYIPDNPLTMSDQGWEAPKSATTGVEQVVLDGMAIDSPEAVVEHLERFVFPRARQAIASFSEDDRVRQILKNEAGLQEKIGPSILKSGYGFVTFPGFRYGGYGYANYFMAYALDPDVIEKDFSLQADLSLLNNQAAARAYREGGLAPLYRLDHDMADSRGTLVDIQSLDRIWLPHFARCLEPMLKADVRLIWHCDGNLMGMVPRLLDVGIQGFQGFQYECGMDYEKICRTKTKAGEELIICAGVSVSRTLPYGTPDDVRRQMAWLVEKGPRTGLFLSVSSSVTPGVPWDNIMALMEGLRHYRMRGRG